MLLQTSVNAKSLVELSDEIVLSDTSVRDVLIHDNIIWFATVDGLNRYDGIETTAYRFEAPFSSDLDQLLVNNHNPDLIWISSNQGIGVFNTLTLKIVSVAHFESGDEFRERVLQMDYLDDDTIVLGTFSKGLLFLDVNTKLVYEPEWNQEFISNKLQNINKRIINLNKTDFGLLALNYTFTGSTGDTIYKVSKDNIVDFYKSSDGSVIKNYLALEDKLWVVTEHSIEQFNPLTNQRSVVYRFSEEISQRLKKDVSVTGLQIYEGNELIIATDGLGAFVYKNGSVMPINHNEEDKEKSNARYFTTEKDEFGTIWIAGANHIDVLYKQDFNLHFYQSIAKNENDESQKVIDHHYFINKLGEQLYFYDNTNIRFTDFSNLDKREKVIYESYYPELRIFQIFENSKGERFGLARETFYKLEEKPKIIFNYNSKILMSHIKDRNDNLWLAEDDTLTVYPLNNEITGIYSKRKVLSHIKNINILAMDKNIIYAGSNNKLYAIDIKTLSVKVTYDLEKSLSRIARILFSEDKIFLLSTSGLTEIDKTTKQQFHIETEKMIIDGCVIGKGELLLLELNDIMHYNIDNRKYSLIASASQLPVDTFSYEGLKLIDNTLYILGDDGILTIGKNDILAKIKTKNKPVVDILKVTSFNDSKAYYINEHKEINLPYEERNFTIYFSNLNSPKNKKIYNRYRMKGFDEDWQNLVNEKTIRFSLSPSDEYVFEVTSSFDGEIWGETKQVRLSVMPPFWRSKLAYLLYTLTGLTLLSIYIYLKYKNITMLKKLSFNDACTGLPNKNHMRIYFKEEVEKKCTIHLIYLNLDDFKKINDFYGYTFGDELIRTLGQNIRAIIPASAALCRLQSDEFVIVMSGDDSKNLAKMTSDTLDELLQSFQKLSFVNKNQVLLTCSMGVSIYPQHARNFTDLLHCAELAVDDVKSSGGNNFKYYSPAFHKTNAFRAKMEVELKRAIENHELQIYVQPISKLIENNYSVIGFEVLSRWPKGPNTFVPPDEYIPVAEKSGLISLVFTAQFEEIISQMNKLPPEFEYISFNLSTYQLYQEDLLDCINEIADKYSVDKSKISFEITETALLNNPHKAKRCLTKLRNNGYGIALDDFGTGFSSLTHLKDFPIDRIKLDKSFTKKIPDSKKCQRIVKHLINLSIDMKIKLIAEGVETEEELEKLNNINCQYYQGYYFNKPIPIHVYLG